MKYWDIFYWNKHEYCWKKLPILAEGNNAYDAIRMAKQALPDFVARNDMLKVEQDLTS